MIHRFSILDLVFLTTAIAGVAAAFRTDVWLGIELASVLSTVSMGGLAVLIWPTAARQVGAAVGFTVALTAVAVIYWQRFEIVGYPFNIVDPIKTVLTYGFIWGAFTLALGTFLSPIAATQWIRSRTLSGNQPNQNLPKRFTAAWLLLTGFLFLAFLAGIDNSNMYSERDWLPLQFVVGLALIWHSIGTSKIAVKWLQDNWRSTVEGSMADLRQEREATFTSSEQ